MKNININIVFLSLLSFITSSFMVKALFIVSFVWLLMMWVSFMNLCWLILVIYSHWFCQCIQSSQNVINLVKFWLFLDCFTYIWTYSIPFQPIFPKFFLILRHLFRKKIPIFIWFTLGASVETFLLGFKRLIMWFHSLKSTFLNLNRLHPMHFLCFNYWF